MAGHGRFFRDDFDRSREFMVTRNFVFNGKPLVSGQPLDKTEFTVRRLRQLYDNRQIAYLRDIAPVIHLHVNGHSLDKVPSHDVEPEPVEPVAPSPPPIERYRPRSGPKPKMVRRRFVGA